MTSYNKIVKEYNMNNKFSSFSPTGKLDKTSNNCNHNNDIGTDSIKGNVSSDDITKLQEKVSKYQSMGRDELMQEFLRLSMSKKQSGNLSKDTISTYRNTLYPYLNDSQKNMFENLMGVIDDECKNR